MVAVIAAHAHVFWMHGGGVGVDIFFAISGFLITYLLLGEAEKFGRIDLGKFWLRRVLRLYPALIVVVIAVDALAVLLSFIRPNEYLQTSLPATPGVLLYFSNWLIVGTDSAFLGWFGPLWSLSVEEQFYLVWPLVVILALRAKKPLKLLAALAACIAVLAAVGRFITFDGENVYRTFGTDFRVDMLLSGVLLAIAMRAGHGALVRSVSRWLIVPAIAFLLAVSVFVPEFGVAGGETMQLIYYRFGLPLVALSSISIIGFLATHQGGRLSRALAWAPIDYMGKMSYGMYLWHYPVTMLILAIFPFAPNSTLLFVAVLAITSGIAHLSFRYLEQPLQRRFHSRLRPSAPAASDEQSNSAPLPTAG